MSLSVALTGIHIASSPGSGAAVSKVLGDDRSLGLIGLVDYPQSCALAWRQVFSAVYLVPQAVDGFSALMDRIIDVHQHHRAIDVLIPCSDDDVLACSNLQQQLSLAGVHTLLPPPSAVLRVRKENLGEAMLSAGLRVAKVSQMLAPYCQHQVSFDYPVVVKGKMCDAYIAVDPSQCLAMATRIADTWGDPVIVQEFIEGDEFSIMAVADRHNRVCGVCSLRKLGITEKGKTWSGYTIESPELEHIAGRICRAIRWVGPLEIECIREEKTGQYVIIEINPRLPAWVRVSTAAGANLPHLVVDLALGNIVESPVRANAAVAFVRNCFMSAFPISRMGELVASGKVEL